KGSTLQFAGHSLGGSLAEIASTYFASKYKDVMVLETSIGAPTSGDKAFGNYSRSLQNLKRTRIVCNTDPVANVKLPGMDYVEKNNVIDFRPNKKNTYWESFKQKLLGSSPGVAVANQLADAAASHSLDEYEDVLQKDFQDTMIDSVNDDINNAIQREEEQYQRSKQDDKPVNGGVCGCECHKHDEAIELGNVPPDSTGAIEKMSKPNQELKQRIGNLETTDVTNVFEQIIHQPQNVTDLKEQNDEQQAILQSRSDELMEMINSSLEAQKQKEDESMRKLQDKYAQLTNQTPDDLDDISKERTTFQRNIEDIQYFQQRIQFEMDHPEYVQEDDYGSKESAVSFKNSINRLYKMILSSNTKRVTDLQNTANVPDEDDIERNVNIDQSEQMNSARDNKLLDPEDQSGPFVFDITKLSDLNTDPAPQSEKQLVEWLGYPNMSPRELFETLKSDMTSQYQQKRLETLRNKEQDKRKSSADKIKAQIENYHNEQGNGTHDMMIQKRQAFFKTLTNNQLFQEMVQQNKVNINAVVAKYQKEGDDVMIMKDLFGYDEKTAQDTITQKYQEQMMKVSPDMTPDERRQVMQESWQAYQANKTYPWVDTEKFQTLYKQYKDDPAKMMEEIQKLKPSIPSNYKYDPTADTTGYNPELMKQNVQNLVNNSSEFVDSQMKDYYKEYRDQIEKSFQDEQKVREMFEQWNPKASTGQKVAAGIRDVLTLGTDKKGGWFDKAGNYLGAGASPDFEDYARNHPELGYYYQKPESNEIIQTLYDLGGQALGMTYGVNPMALLDGMAGREPAVTNQGQIINNYYGGEEENNMSDAFNPYAWMNMMGGGGGGGGG
ncbi:MAG: lipase family protein, partial [Sulfuricurvum sp.]